MIRAACAAVLLLAAPAARAQPAFPDSAARGADFDALWSFVADEYAYPERLSADWPAVRRLYRPAAVAAETRRAFVTVLERALAELADAHAHLGTNTPGSPRLVPSGADVWAEWEGDRAVVTSVRRGSGAERAGVQAGDVVTAVDGVPVRAAVEARLPRTRRPGDARADGPALLAALAGTHDRPVTLGVERDAEMLTFTPGETALPDGLVAGETRPGNVGVVRVLNALGDGATVAAFDSVLAGLRDTRGLVLDLRDTPGGGNSGVARGILSRFVAAERPYQRHERPAEARATGVGRAWVELVLPRGPFRYTAPVVVLVGRWTGSMGEGLAVGFDALGRGALGLGAPGRFRVVGTPMAGLLGALGERRLPNTGLVVRIPTERLTHVEGTPREAFVPEALPPGGPSDEPGRDDALDAAIRLLGAVRR